MTRQQINWEIEAIEKCSAIAKSSISNKEALNAVLQDHEKQINELKQ